jgi:hypothetical protein
LGFESDWLREWNALLAKAQAEELRKDAKMTLLNFVLASKSITHALLDNMKRFKRLIKSLGGE